MLGKILWAKGGENLVQPLNGDKFTLEELQRAVGGYIEIVPLTDKTVMVVDEEGKLKGKEINVFATALYQGLRKVNDYIVGDVIVCPAKMID